MKQLSIGNAQEVILALHDEIRRADEARYDHRLHAVLLVAQGMSCREAALRLGDAPRTVQNWVNAFEAHGLRALHEQLGRGRKRILNEEGLKRVGCWLRQSPRELGVPGNLWDGPGLRSALKQHMDVELSTRQCQRLFRQLGFRYRLPRPEVAKADPEKQRAHKKTRHAGG
jgi:transposase